MANTMTYKQALNIAIDTIKDEVARERLVTLRDTLEKRSGSKSDTAKEKAKGKRVAARAEMVAQVMPILRSGLKVARTCEELYDEVKDSLPEGFTPAKIQYILNHEMADEVNKVVSKYSPNVYMMKA